MAAAAQTPGYVTLDIIVGSLATGDVYPTRVALDNEPAAGEGALPHEVALALRSSSDLGRAGEQLASALFTGAIAEAFVTAQGRARQKPDTRLRVRLQLPIDDQELQQLP